MRYLDFCRMSPAAQKAKARARWLVELGILRREHDWRMLRLRVWAIHLAAWIRAHVEDFVLLALIVACDAAFLRLIYLFGRAFFPHCR